MLYNALLFQKGALLFSFISWILLKSAMLFSRYFFTPNVRTLLTAYVNYFI